MDFRLLGPFEVEDCGRVVEIGGPKQRLVLAQLALRTNEVVSVDRLIHAIWADDPPESARNTLQTYVRHLRKAVGAQRIVHRPPGYVLVADKAEVDSIRFVDLARQAHDLAATDPALAVETFRSAFVLWRGSVLDDLAGQVSLHPDIARLEAVRMSALEERIGIELDLERHDVLIPELERLVREYPLRERLLGHLMTALYRAGRQADALTVFGRAGALLREELGIDPSNELQHLQRRILRHDPALAVAGRQLRGYRLLEILGVGTLGSVHRAVHGPMNRDVAIKAIHPRFANDPDFIRRFDRDAQALARLEHPHVVSIYDYWREPGGAFLVMRYLREGSLAQRLDSAPLPAVVVVRMVDQLASALDAAHRQGLVHGLVKPENVLFDENDNVYLSDFGISTQTGNEEGVHADYRAPEQRRGAAESSRTDVFGLGVLIGKALAGSVSSAVLEVVAIATAADPAARYASAPEVAVALRQALAEPTSPDSKREVRNPYKGLRAFQEADAADFFGRECFVKQLLSRMAEPVKGARFIGVVGPSGVGKSSVVAAGLVPALRAGALPDSQQWFIATMHPGSNPLEELAAALLPLAVGPTPDIAELLAHEDGLVAAADAVLPDPEAELLLVIDQFEELFTLVEDSAVRASFLAALVVAATDPHSRVRVVVTLRADFYDRPLADPRFGELLARRTEALAALSVEELERAICGPAEGVGVQVEALLVAEIIREVAYSSGALPLLQYALTELFDEREQQRLTLAAYRELDGLSGALTRRAEELYSGAGDAGRIAVEQMFFRLISLGRGQANDIRRRVLRIELGSLEVDESAMEWAIDAFGRHRLLTFDRDPVSRLPTVEVAHEALIRGWDRLGDWLETAREDVLIQRRLAAAAAEWSESGQDNGFLLRGERLARLAETKLVLTRDERAFLHASIARHTQEVAADDARRVREVALERRSVVRLQALVAVLATLALVAAGLTTFVLVQQARIEHEARVATARELAAAAVANLETDPERSILLALEAVEVTRGTDGTVTREAQEALRQALQRSRVTLSVPQGGGLAVSADGARFATTGVDGTATVWDMRSGKSILVLDGHEGAVTDVAIAPSGDRLSTTGADGSVRVWDMATGAQLLDLRGHRGAVTRVAFSPDGRRLATSGADATVRVWDAATGRQQQLLGDGDNSIFGTTEAARPAFSPDGTRLAGARGDGTISVYDLGSGAHLVTLVGHGWDVTDIEFGPGGSRVATASTDGTARVWDVASGTTATVLLGHKGDVTAVAYSPDGTRVATGGTDGTARIWDVATGRQLRVLAGHTGELGEVAFSPDGSRLVTSGADGTTRVWNIDVGGGRDWLTVAGANARYAGIAFSHDSLSFVVPGDDSGAAIRSAETGEITLELKGHQATLASLSFSPDGRRLAAAAGNGATQRAANNSVPIWDTATGRLVMKLVGHSDEVSGVVHSPDGNRILTSSFDGTLRLWDANSGALIRRLTVGTDAWALAFTPDGRSFLAGPDPEGGITIWDTTTLTPKGILRVPKGHIQGVAVSPDGRRAVTAGTDGTARIWDLGSLRELYVLRGHTGVVNSVAISPDGARVATAGSDGVARLWDAATGLEVLTLYGHDANVHSVVFSPDGRLLATASVDGTIALHLLPIDELRTLAATRITRTLTDEECRQYLHRASCPPRLSHAS